MPILTQKGLKAQKTLAVANYFIEKGLEEGKPVDPLKLQKLMYFAHGWHLAVRGTPLIDECVEAWPYGPVVPTVYHEFKHYGDSPITSPALDIFGEEVLRVTDPSVLEVLDKVWKEYRNFSGLSLSSLSHASGSPWEAARKRAEKDGKTRGVDIEDRAIQAHFIKQATLKRDYKF